MTTLVQTFKDNQILDKVLSIVAIFAVVALLFLISVGTSFAMDADGLKTAVDDHLGADSFAQKLIGGIALIVGIIILFTGNIKMGVTIIFVTAVIFLVYNSGLIF
ncbi:MULTISPECIES: hypothetical protein [Cysteiniphilum]|uniref:hypothetical protein n=1 Tax=Cysteiniphilum TaxID=2056696 RepID=UPI001780FEE9|nr:MULTISPECIES: hypothetical protein [Cysteiniphilum]